MSAHVAAAHPAQDVGRLAMWVFLATEVLFFGGLFVAYLYGRTHWPEGFGMASRRTDVLLGTINTGVLLTSSALVAFAVDCSGSSRTARWSAWLLGATAVLGVGFLAIKGFEYRKEWHEGLFPGPAFAMGNVPGAELFFALYFVTTGLHALHLAVGIGVVAVFGWGRWRCRRWADGHRLEIGALYWHFVDIVWIFLYPLLYLVNRHA